MQHSELVALTIDVVVVLPEGIRITIRRSKGDQEGEGQMVAIGRTGTCPSRPSASRFCIAVS